MATFIPKSNQPNTFGVRAWPGSAYFELLPLLATASNEPPAPQTARTRRGNLRPQLAGNLARLSDLCEVGPSPAACLGPLLSRGGFGQHSLALCRLSCSRRFGVGFSRG